MTVDTFVDTNVFVYGRDASEGAKQEIASDWIRRLWRERRGRTSIQALNEYYVTVTRKLLPGLPPDEAWDDLRALLSWRPQEITAEVLMEARQVEQRYGLSWWDAMIVGAARLQSCPLLLSEDLQDGCDYGGVVVRNPFTVEISEERAAYGTSWEAVVRHRPRGRPSRSRLPG